MNLTAKCNLCKLSDIEREAATTGASVVLRHGSYYVAEGAGIHVFVAPTGETPDTAERSDRTHGSHSRAALEDVDGWSRHALHLPC